MSVNGSFALWLQHLPNHIKTIYNSLQVSYLYQTQIFFEPHFCITYEHGSFAEIITIVFTI